MKNVKGKFKKVNVKMWLLLLALLAFLFFNIVAAAGLYGFSEMVDILTLTYMAGVTVLTLWFTGIGKEFINGFRLTFLKQKDVSRIEIQKAYNALRFIQKIVFFEAGVIAVINLVNLLYHMTDLHCLGPSLAASLLSFLYAVVFALILSFPEGRLKMELISYMDETVSEGSTDDAQTQYFKLRGMGLTDREAEVARLVSCEMTNREIGEMLYISEATVKKHITHVLEKTGKEDREQLTDMIRNLP